ncbi:hypothetical protein [Lentimicrobium sp. S6]|uniref:hypothetical protein n=1 Tax=Lentimicrobium sp. S6 TaxID=2735872 RepID=UPI001555EBD3|nr:hypothetical protein [Lentimicrobium sp. S6]NPD48194.1 hypothetical protein [Lentimicrobium sp. S6]
MKLLKAALFIILSLVLLISCGNNQFSSAEGIAIQQSIGEEYLEYPLVELSFEKLVKGEEFRRIDIAIHDAKIINAVLADENFDEFGEVNPNELLQTGFFSSLIDTFSIRYQRSEKQYKALYDLCYTFNHWGNDVVLPMKFEKLDMEKYSRLYDKLSIYQERYIELAGEEPTGIGVMEYYVKFRIKTNPNSIELDKYRRYQLYLPSYSMASMNEVNAHEFPEME